MTGSYLDWDGARPAAGYQGIEYLDLDLLPTPDDPIEVRLTVHLHRPPTGMDDRSFEIAGEALDEAVEWTLVSVTAGADPRAVLAFDWIDDEMRLSLTLLQDGAALVHPFFSTVDFLLDIDCPKGDCRPARDPSDLGSGPSPAVDLLTKDYDGFVQLLSDRLGVANPSWADLAPASLERVLVELLSHFGDMTSYYQDRVANEAFVDDASQRYSLRQHATLLGYQLFDGVAAETVVAFTSANDGFVPAGVALRMVNVVDEAPITFYLPEQVRVLPAHNDLPVAAWPDAHDATIAAGAGAILLLGHVDDLPGRRLAFRQREFVQVVTVADVRQLRLPGWTASPSDPLTTTLADVTEVRFSAPLAQTVSPFDTGAGAMFHLLGNLGTARHGEERTALLNTAPTPGRRTAQIVLDRQNSTVVRVERGAQSMNLLRAVRVPEGPVLFGGRTEGMPLPVMEVKVNGEVWERRDHLHSSQSFDPHYVATADEDGAVWLQFGDGLNGSGVEVAAGPAPGPQLTITYRAGDPGAGNCAPGALTEVVPPSDQAAADQLAALGLDSVENIIPGTGGRLPETRDAARQAIPASLRHGPLQRAVSLEDYAQVAKELPEVSRATARALGGPFNAVQVLVDPRDQAELTDELARMVENHLETRRMTGREVVVDRPSYVPLEVDLAVCAEPGIPPHRVRDAVYRTLRPQTGGHRGYFHPDTLSFAAAVELGDVLAEVQRVPGVRSVKALAFRKLAVAGSGPVEARITVRGSQVARLDADESRPADGRLVVQLMDVDAVDESRFLIFEASDGPP